MSTPEEIVKRWENADVVTSDDAREWWKTYRAALSGIAAHPSPCATYITRAMRFAALVASTSHAFIPDDYDGPMPLSPELEDLNVQRRSYVPGSDD